MTIGDDADKVSGQFHWEGKERRMVGTGGEKMNKKDNFGKSLDPGTILAQNMQSTQSAWKNI